MRVCVQIERLRLDLLSRKSHLHWEEVFGGDVPLTLPLHPCIPVVGLLPEEATIFKSKKKPIRMVFQCRDHQQQRLAVLLKHEDDLRQDQLILYLIGIMDGLLRDNGLDLKLTCYRVLATNWKSGG